MAIFARALIDCGAPAPDEALRTVRLPGDGSASTSAIDSTAHDASLFDIDAKYGDMLPRQEVEVYS